MKVKVVIHMANTVNWMRVVEGAASGKFAVEVVNADGVWENISGWLDTEVAATTFADDHYDAVAAALTAVAAKQALDLDTRVIVGNYNDKGDGDGYVPVIGE
jgi:hypothetical protein